MKLGELIAHLGLSPVELTNADVEVKSAYSGDLLSDVLAHAQPDSIWFTVQAHVNIVAVAQIRDIACVVLTNGVAPDPQTVAKAKSQGVNLCASECCAADLCMKLVGKLT